MKPASIFHPDFLLETLYSAALDMDLREFVHFHVDSINSRVKGLDIDMLAMSVCEMQDGKLTDHSLAGAVAYGSHTALTHWKDMSDHDDLTPVLLCHPGTAMFASSIGVEAWKAHPMYDKHCKPFGIEETASIVYRCPLSRRNVLMLVYCWSGLQRCPSALSEEVVEYISFPFYLGYLHIVGAICNETLYDWLHRCAKMSMPRFLVLRSMAGQGVSRASDLAEALGVSVASIQRHTENAHETLLQRQSEDRTTCEICQEAQAYDGNANRVIALTRHYHFFSYVPGQIRRSLPRRPVPTVQPA